MTDDESRLEALLDLVYELKSDMNGLKVNMNNAEFQRRQNFVTVTRGVDSLGSRIDSLGSEVSVLSSKIDRLQVNSDRMQLDIMDIRDDIVELKSGMMALNNKIDQHNARPH
jgi:peptidoglycan hydrolase CwlO-like protein